MSQEIARSGWTRWLVLAVLLQSSLAWAFEAPNQGHEKEARPPAPRPVIWGLSGGVIWAELTLPGRLRRDEALRPFGEAVRQVIGGAELGDCTTPWVDLAFVGASTVIRAPMRCQRVCSMSPGVHIDGEGTR